MTPVSRKAYDGPHRKLVIAFDVGTTFSGISFCILSPGIVPEIRGVNRFPAQEQVGGDSKIPSILWYDLQGEVKAVGAEALSESLIERAEDELWTKADWFKMHLRPKALAAGHVQDADIPPLPPNKTAVQVFADMLKYLLKCAHDYIRDTYYNGPELISDVTAQSRTEYVLTHPNGWEGAQQGQMRKAAVMAGLVPDTPEGQARIRLVTEGEASLHFCITSGSTVDMNLQVGEGIIVIDAGGGTVDLSAYRLRSRPNEFEEIAPPQCRLQGSIFVNRRAKRHFEQLLRGTRFSSPEDLENITKCFDSTTKLRFKFSHEPAYVKFGTMRDSEPRVGIRSGQLKIPGEIVAKMFEPSVNAIVEAILELKQSRSIQHIFLVGGFAASEWLHSQIKKHLAPQNLAICRPDTHQNKAVADGGIAFYLDRNVRIRVAPLTYGIEMLVSYDRTRPLLKARRGKLLTWPSGRQFIPNQFSVILKKGTQVSEEREFRREYCLEKKDPSELNSISVKILCYRGTQNPEPSWTDDEPGMFPLCCTINADTTRMARSLVPIKTQTKTYYRQRFDVVMSFGLTELTAQVAWMENDIEMRSPATVIFDQV